MQVRWFLPNYHNTELNRCGLESTTGEMDFYGVRLIALERNHEGCVQFTCRIEFLSFLTYGKYEEYFSRDSCPLATRPKNDRETSEKVR